MTDRVRIIHTVDYTMGTRRVVLDWPADAPVAEAAMHLIRALDDAGLPRPVLPFDTDDTGSHGLRVTMFDADAESRGAHVLRVG